MPNNKTSDHRKTANATADAPSATAAFQAREPNSGDAEFLGLGTVVVFVEFVAGVAVGPGADVLEVVTVTNRDVVAVVDVTGSTDLGVGGEGASVHAGREGTEVVTPAVPFAKLGGGTAFEGSLSAPVPQGMAAFEGGGWVASVGGVVVPSGAAMVKRVAHCGAVAPGAVNW